MLEVPFLVASEIRNSAKVPCFAILISVISTCLPPFLLFRQFVHGNIEAIQITLHV